MESLDFTLFQFINQDLSNPIFDFLCPLFRNKMTWVPFYLIGAVACVYFYKKIGIAIIVSSILLIAATDQSSNFLKKLIQKQRPCATEMSVVLRVKKCSQSFAMPSAHAANHIALAVFLSGVLPLQKRWKTILIGWAFFIAFSQIYVGLHFPSDIVGGLFLGTVWGCIFYWLFNKQKNKIWQQNLLK